MKHFKKQIENVKMNCEQEIEDLKDSALVEFSRNLKLSGKFKLLEDAQSKLESSEDLTTVEYDHEFMHQYIRFDFSDIIDVDSELERELLVRFLEENDFFMIPDFENSLLTMNIGPCICIGDDGIVWDQDSNYLDGKTGRIKNGTSKNDILVYHFHSDFRFSCGNR